MKSTSARRYRRRSATRDTVALKKDARQEQQFFGAATYEPFFRPGSTHEQSVTIQRKCADCEGEEKVQRVPEKKEEEKVQRAADKKEEEKVMKKEDKKEEEKIQKKEGMTGTAAASVTAGSYISSIDSKGKSMNPDVQSFYESRIGADFSDVKIHTGKEAEESAKDINAQAYTYRNHIVFNEGKFQPGSSDGKHLLAHELAHVVQQDNGRSADAIRRKTSFSGSSVNDLNMATKFTEAVKNGTNASYVGITVPYLNGHDLTKTQKSSPMKIPALTDIQAVQNGDKWESSVKNIPTNSLTYKVHLPAKPSGKVWSDFVDAANLGSLAKCNGQINVYITGKPSVKDFTDSIEAHEQVHVTHLKEAHDGMLTTFDKHLGKAKATGATEPESKEKLQTALEKAAGSITSAIGTQFNTKATDFHGTAAGSPAKFSVTAKDTSCMWIKVNVSV